MRFLPLSWPCPWSGPRDRHGLRPLGSPRRHAGEEVHAVAVAEALEIERAGQARIALQTAGEQQPGVPGQAGADDPAAALGVLPAGVDHIAGDVAQLALESGAVRQLLQPGHLPAGPVVRVEEPSAGAQHPRDLAQERRVVAVSMRCLDADHGTERAVAERQLQRMAADEGEVADGSMVPPAERDGVGGVVQPDDLNLPWQAARQMAETAAAAAADLEHGRDVAIAGARHQQLQQLGVELELEALRRLALGRREAVIVGGRLAPAHGVEAVVQLLASRTFGDEPKQQLAHVVHVGHRPPFHRARARRRRTLVASPCRPRHRRIRWPPGDRPAAGP